MMSLTRESLADLFFVFLCLAGIGFSGFHRVMSPGATSQPAPYYPPPKQLVHFSFGYNSVGADILWVRVLQDLDYCERKVSEQECVSKGWLFKVLDLATELDPRFLMPHQYGALGLSVLVSDVLGSALIFEKGVQRFPEVWQISYWAGYHAMAEERDVAKAAKYLELSARKGAPSWVYSLAAKLYTEAGQRELAVSLLRELEKADFDPVIVKRMKTRIGWRIESNGAKGQSQ